MSGILRLKLVVRFFISESIPFYRAPCCHPCNCSSIHVFIFTQDEMNNLSRDELFVRSGRWIMYFIEMFEQIKIWCYCKIWNFFWLQIIFICNNCICFNVKIYICIKPVLDLKKRPFGQNCTYAVAKVNLDF